MSGTSSFTSTSLADYASNLPGAIDTDPNKKKKSQITGTMLLGGQNGTFNGDLDLEELKQQLEQSPNGYQPPANYGMNQQQTQMPQQAVPPTLSSPSLPPPVGASPITGEFQQPPQQQPIQMPQGNQPYQPIPPIQQPMVTGDTTVDKMLQDNINIQQLQDQNFSQLDPAIQQQRLADQQKFLTDQENTKSSFFDVPFQQGPGLGQPPYTTEPSQELGDSFQGPPAGSSNVQWRQNAAGEWESYNPQMPDLIYQGAPVYNQPKVAGPINPSYAQIGFPGRFQDKNGGWIT